MSTDSTNGWHEYKQLVLRELERLTQEIRHERNNYKQGMSGVYERLIEVEKEIATLKVRCGIWGLMGGLIPAMTALMLART
jgi:hypothetical protein|tara:strand:+ start:217 stop:459 length:243 start_codon:yes stop_codon:yes gene_type:complete